MFLQIIIWILYLAAFLLSEAVISRYAVAIPVTACGYLLFLLARKMLADKKILILNITVISAGVLTALSFICSTFLHNPVLSLCAVGAHLFAIGYIGGAVRCFVGPQINEKKKQAGNLLYVLCLLGAVVLAAESNHWFPLLAMILFSLDTSFHEKNPSPEIEPLPEPDRKIMFGKQYMLTGREQEVFEKLITTEDNVQEMADSLFLSRRTFQRYVKSIYEKTGVKSRMGLYQIYISANLKSDSDI